MALADWDVTIQKENCWRMTAPELLHEDGLSALPNPLDAPMDKCEDPFSHQGPGGGLKERKNVKGKNGQCIYFKTGQIYLLTTIKS